MTIWTAVSIHPSNTQRVRICVKDLTGVHEVEGLYRFTKGKWYNARTGEQVIQRIVSWTSEPKQITALPDCIVEQPRVPVNQPSPAYERRPFEPRAVPPSALSDAFTQAIRSKILPGKSHARHQAH